MDKNKLAEEYAVANEQATLNVERIKRAYLAGFDAAESIANAKIQELEQQLKKAESVIEFYGDERNHTFRRGGETKTPMKEDLGKLARQYLKSRGERNDNTSRTRQNSRLAKRTPRQLN